MEVPKLTPAELDRFLNKVEFWETHQKKLNHIWFEQDAINYARKRGYTFEKVNEPRQTYYLVKKV